MRLHYGGMLMSPVCPEGATYMKIRNFQYLGNILDFEYWCSALNNVNSAIQMYPYKVALTLRASSGSGASPLQWYNTDTNTYY